MLPQQVPVVIIGGGIVGAGLFRDLSLHQIPSLLIDKKDFNSQTSQKSSKMLHGGIRYLEQFDFGLVREALYEKNLWNRLASHLCREEAFYLPVYRGSLRPLWMIRLGLFLYDCLSGFKNRPHEILSKEELLMRIPQLKREGLTGGGAYHDVVVEDAKLGLELIYDALLFPGATALNHTELNSVQEASDGTFVLEISELFSGQKKRVQTKRLVFATGPFSDGLFKNLALFPWEDVLLPTIGSHLWIDKKALSIQHPCVITPSDGRVIFVIPQRNAVLVGTTERDLSEGDKLSPFDLKITKEEKDYLLTELNSYLETISVQESDILSSFSGIRPLVREQDESSSSKTSREHKVFRPKENIWAIIGGKYTTFRPMSQEIAREILLTEKLSYNPSLSKTPLRSKSAVNNFDGLEKFGPEDVIKAASLELAANFEDLVVRRLSIPAKNHWDQEIPFEEFFTNLLPSLKNYISISHEDIFNF